MPDVCAERNPYAECRVVVEPRADGPVIGFYDGRPIATSIVDGFGRHYVYRGAASRREDGRYDFNALAPDEWLVEPGLVYAYSSDDINQLEIRLLGETGGRRLRALKEALVRWFH
jgi:hypothetical protein